MLMMIVKGWQLAFGNSSPTPQNHVDMFWHCVTSDHQLSWPSRIVL
jgi:hypothetical protein